METKQLDITIEEARELYNNPKFKSIVLRKWTEEELFPKEPKTWEEILFKSGKKGFFDYNGEFKIRNLDVVNSSCLGDGYSCSIPTYKDSQKIKALCKISVIADYYNGKSLNIGKRYSPLYSLATRSLLIIISDVSNYFPFVFYSKEYLQEAIDNNRETFKTALS